MIELNVFVEGNQDAVWVNILLHRAFPRTDLLISTKPSGKKAEALKRFVHVESYPDPIQLGDQVVNVALVDADVSSLPDAKIALMRKLGEERLSDKVFFAVPTLESWLFADMEAARKQLGKKSAPVLDRVQFPDEIPHPKLLAAQTFGPHERTFMAGQRIIESMDLERAMSRSPSMREFLAGIARLIGEDGFQPVPDAERLIGRRLLGQLVSETNPSSRVLYRTMAGDRLTASRLAKEISQGTPIARQYAADLLRIARELLANEAATSIENPEDRGGKQ